MLFKNTLAQSGSLLLGYLFSFLLAPIMIARLGLDAFGVWAVTGAFATYAGLLDLGIGRSLSRFIAVFDAEGRERRIRECVGLGLIAVTIVALAASAVVWFGASVLSDRLGVLSAEEMRVVALSSVGIWTFNGYHGVLGAVGIGKLRMMPPNVADAISVTINFLASIAALAISTSLVLYAIANAAAALVALIPAFFAMRYVWHAPYVALPSGDLVKEVLGFSVKNQIGWLADLVNFQTDKVVIALAVGIKAAAVYEIASRVVMAVRGAAILTISAIIPTAASRIVTEGRQVVDEMYRRYTLRSCSIAFPLFVFVSVSAPFFLAAWLGDAPGDSELLVPFLTLPYLINITTGVGSTIAIGAGHPGMVSSNSVLIAALNVVLTVALAPVFGLWGVAAGTFLAVSLGSIRFTQRFLRLFELPWGAFLKGVLPTGVLALALVTPALLLALVVGTPEARPEAAILLAASAAVYAIPYWVLASRFGYLPPKLRVPSLRRGGTAETSA